MKHILSHFGQFLYRVPFFSYDAIHSRLKDLSCGQADEFLHEYLSKPAVREAIFLASPSFDKEVALYLEGGIAKSDNAARHDKFVTSAMKYIVRMASRPTPFGMFAGCGIGKVGDEDRIAPDPENPLLRRVRPDTGFLISVYEEILKNKEQNKWFRYFTNNTIYPAGGQYRYVEFFGNTGGQRIYNLSSFEKSDFVDLVLDSCRQGLYFEEIAALVTDDEISQEEAAEFVQELLASRILICELEPAVVGEEYDRQFVRVLRSVLEKYHGADDVGLDQLKVICSILVDCTMEFDRLYGRRDYAADIYLNVNEKLRSLEAKSNREHLLQVDARSNCRQPAVISEALAGEIVDGIHVLTRFGKHFRGSRLAGFSSAFEKKYEGRMVPLTEVLDPEIGIGYSSLDAGMLDYSDLVDDVPVPPHRSGPGVASISWDMEVHTFFFNKILAAYKADAYTITLDNTDIGQFAPNTSLPATLNAFVNVAFREDGRPLIRYQQIGGSSATSIMGRFSFLDEAIGAFAREVAGHESAFYGHAAVAEINHLADAKTGNITVRDSIRSYEIPYITKSNSTGEGLIPVSDLYLFSRGGKVTLYSKSLGMPVIPRLSNAHNYNMNTLPAYKFLSEYQGEAENGGYNLHLDLGQLNEFFAFIPRILYGNIIFSPAQWSFRTDEIRQLMKGREDEENISAVTQWLTERKVPRRFYVVERGDNEMLCDMGSALSMQLFLRMAASIEKMQLRECFAGEGQGLVKNDHGNYYHELVLPLKNIQRQPQRPAARTPLPAADTTVRRVFMPGSEWLYLKIYTGIDTGDKIIQQVLPALAAEWEKDPEVRQWFFIRYTDPDFHIRLRIRCRGKIDRLLAAVHKKLAPYTGSGLVTKVLIDTYERELERYGAASIDAAEAIFEADSLLVTEILQSAEERSERWKCGLRAMDEYMNVFEMDLEQKYGFVKKIRDQFAEEFNANKIQKRKIINKYRAGKAAIDQYFETGSEALAQALQKFRARLEPHYREAYAGNDQKDYFLQSFIHMHIDRLVRSKNRMTEYILYSYLEQHYRYEIGKRKHLNYAE